MYEEDLEKLQAEKLDVDERIRTIKATLTAAKSRAATKGRYMQPERYAKLQNQLIRYQVRSQTLQGLIGSANKTRRKRTLRLPQVFMTVAEEVLPEETFHHILHVALDRREQGGDK